MVDLCEKASCAISNVVPKTWKRARGHRCKGAKHACQELRIYEMNAKTGMPPLVDSTDAVAYQKIISNHHIQNNCSILPTSPIMDIAEKVMANVKSLIALCPIFPKDHCQSAGRSDQ